MGGRLKRRYRPRVDPRRPTSRRHFFSHATASAATGRYYFPDKSRDFNNNSMPRTARERTKLSSAFSSSAQPVNSEMPSRWYTVLALPFPDQTVGRRDILGAAYGRRSRQLSHEQEHYLNEEMYSRSLGRIYRPIKVAASPPTFTVSESPSPTLSSNLQLFSNSPVDECDSSSIATSALYQRPPTDEYYSSDHQPSL